jgi:hypothetical protein
MAIYKTKVFDRLTKKAGPTSKQLCNAIEEIERGLFDADLGAGLIKKRIARAGGGKSGGFRTLIAFQQQERYIFLYVFGKNDVSNIDKDEEKALKALAAHFLALTDLAIKKAADAGELIGVNCDAENEVIDS